MKYIDQESVARSPGLESGPKEIFFWVIVERHVTLGSGIGLWIDELTRAIDIVKANGSKIRKLHLFSKVIVLAKPKSKTSKFVCTKIIIIDTNMKIKTNLPGKPTSFGIIFVRFTSSWIKLTLLPHPSSVFTLAIG